MSLSKGSLNGLEVEYHLIDSWGRVANTAEDIINTIKKKHPRVRVEKEIGRSIIEIGSLPDHLLHKSMADFCRNLEIVSTFCDKHELSVFPFATYPGNFQASWFGRERYYLQEAIFGKGRNELASMVTGYHYHYSLPKGVFNKQHKELQMQKRNKFRDTLVSTYNFEIASDPALTLLMQSS